VPLLHNLIDGASYGVFTLLDAILEGTVFHANCNKTLSGGEAQLLLLWVGENSIIARWNRVREFVILKTLLANLRQVDDFHGDWPGS
jgi:hypothetical protein